MHVCDKMLAIKFYRVSPHYSAPEGAGSPVLPIIPGGLLQGSSGERPLLIGSRPFLAAFAFLSRLLGLFLLSLPFPLEDVQHVFFWCSSTEDNVTGFYSIMQRMEMT